MAKPTLSIDPSFDPRTIRPALVWGFDVAVDGDTAALAPWLDELCEKARAKGDGLWPEGRKAAVRDMLRYKTYKPTGRGKPASEYLLASAIDGAFPQINPLVDINNAISLESGFPCSLFDLSRTGSALLLKRGSQGDSYAFNQSGQEIELNDLACIWFLRDTEWRACGNPVKDSMETKYFADKKPGHRGDLAAVIYAPSDSPADELERFAARFAGLLASHCRAREAGWEIPL